MAFNPQIDFVAKRTQIRTPCQSFSFGNADSLRLMTKMNGTPLLTGAVDTNVTIRSRFFSVPYERKAFKGQALFFVVSVPYEAQ